MVGGGGHVFSLIQEGGFEKLMCDFMGGCEKNVDLKKNHLPPPPCSIHNECSPTESFSLVVEHKSPYQR